MSLINSDVIPASAPAGYTIDQSLRFNDNDSAYLSRTPSSAGNRRTFTYSCWFKNSITNTSSGIFFNGRQDDNNQLYSHILTDGRLLFFWRTNSSTSKNLITSAKYRDPSAWYHYVVKVDTTQATATNRLKIYINGEEVTDFDTDNRSSMAQNEELFFNSTFLHTISKYAGASSYYFDGYMAEINFIDGQALDPSYFGETGDYGEWKPIEYTGSYGTNGFYLDFGDTYYNDKSGNGNNWTATNLATTDVVLDSPTNNFCTFNPLDRYSDFYHYDGNLRSYSVSASTVDKNSKCTFGVSSGKWYWEMMNNRGASGLAIGIADASETSVNYFVGGTSLSYSVYGTSGNKVNGGTSTAYGDDFATLGDIVSVALDMDAGTINFWVNGVDQGQAFSGLSGTKIPAICDGSSSQYADARANFGQDSSFAGTKTAQGNTDSNGIGDFYYTPPTGYLALCTANLPDPAVIPSENFNTVLYTGTGASRSITGVGFQPDFVWTKSRNYEHHHILANVLVSGYYLYSSSSNGDSTIANAISSFDTDGYSMGSASSLNQSSINFVSWNWKANGSGVSNTNGTITSTVSANQDAGFSIVTYTGTGSNATVGHGLSQAPEMLIVKSRSDSSNNWMVYAEPEGNTDYAHLNLTNAFGTASTVWQNTTPTSSVFSIGTANGVNQSTYNFIAYAFHSVDGYSKVGSYTGNGSTDGTFVYTGFRPAMIIMKRTDSAVGWMIVDNKRDSYNVADARLNPNSYGQEATNVDFADYTSNGFKIRTTDAGFNASGGTYIYIAFAETPFSVGGGIAR